jgi:uncharacterized membrane protein
MECVDAGTAAHFALTARRNNSLSSSGRLLVFGFVCFVSIGIGLALAVVFGAWPIMPYAGLEMVVLYLAFRHIERHAGDYERFAIAGDRLEVEVRDGVHLSRFDCNRHWARIVYDKEGRFAVRSYGRDFEIGRHLSEQQRLSVARQLEHELHERR